MTRLIERKADHKDLKQMQEEKVTKVDLVAGYVPRKDFEELRINTQAFNKVAQDYVGKHCKYKNH